jgi:hypothetical protein
MDNTNHTGVSAFVLRFGPTIAIPLSLGLLSGWCLS